MCNGEDYYFVAILVRNWVYRLIVLVFIEEFTLIVASWVIRARWREMRRFVLEFKASLFFLNSYI